MAQIASSPSSLSELKLPEPRLPKVNLDALFGLQKANLATLHEVQNVLFDAGQAIALAQHGWAEEIVAAVRAALSRKEPGKPEALVEETKAAAEKALAVVRQSVELAAAAQRRVGELLVQRSQSNAEELKAALAA